MIPSSVAIEIENGGDFATFLGEESFFLPYILSVLREEFRGLIVARTSFSF
jgi:hypothetical protein